jgi:hypothetical protein
MQSAARRSWVGQTVDSSLFVGAAFLLLVEGCSSGSSTTSDGGPLEAAHSGDGQGPRPDSGHSHDSGQSSDSGPHGEAGLMDASGDTGSPEGSVDGGCGSEEDAGAWSPMSAGTNLVVWLKSGVGITTSACDAGTCVQTWEDQSSHGNNAVISTGGRAPSLASYTCGHKGLVFDAQTTSMRLLNTALGGDAGNSLDFAGNAYTVFFVAETTEISQIGCLYSKQAGSPSTYPGPSFWLPYANGSALASTGQFGTQVDVDQFLESSEMALTDGTVRLYSARFDGTNLALRVDSDTPATRTVTVTPNFARNTTNAWFGGAPSSGQIFGGNILEVVFISTNLSDTDWTSAASYFVARFALP